MKIAIILFVLVALTSCANPPTAAQVQGWADVGHTVIHNGLQDAKDVQSVTRDW